MSSTSATQLVSTLAPTFLVTVILVILFLIFRTKFPRIYEPRTFVGSLRHQERSPGVKKGIANWYVVVACPPIPPIAIVVLNSRPGLVSSGPCQIPTF